MEWTAAGAQLSWLSLMTVVLLAAVATLLVAHRRQRRRIQLLLEQLESVETSGHFISGSPQPASEPDNPGSGTKRAPSADVLAGKSSFVRRVIDGGDEMEGLAVQAIACVHQRLDEALTPAGLAEELCLSLRSLERGLAAYLQCTPRQLIVAMKMREARRLLESGRFRVNEVAHRLAFADLAHFSRRFKAFYSVPPSKVIPAPGQEPPLR
jgi:AraC-like DNA-binding protein